MHMGSAFSVSPGRPVFDTRDAHFEICSAHRKTNNSDGSDALGEPT